MELTILMPCLNEAETLAICIKKAKRSLETNQIDGEVCIADNGSTDGSQQIATSCGARVIHVDEKGYGSALRGGIAAAKGKYVIMGDADDSYDFSNLMPFVEKLREGADLVMGNRFKGGIAEGAMPPLHRYLGNPVLSAIGKIFFRAPCADFHCGLRGFRRESIERLNLVTTGMEFASEMVVRASLDQMNIVEVPTTLSPDGRSRPPHLRSWRDGWRHLRFMALYEPHFLFVYPGILLALFGLVTSASMIITPYKIFGYEAGPQRLLYMMMLFVVGLQGISFGFFARYLMSLKLHIPARSLMDRMMDRFSMEAGVFIGFGFILAGIVLFLAAFGYWGGVSFGELDNLMTIRWVAPSIGSVVVGTQLVGSSLFLACLKMVLAEKV
jgi:glycosyltransferase involved in cell wall biosynthesis